jgi:replicative DNA helicase
MKLSAPIYVLKSRAKELKNSKSIPLSEALDEIAKQEGFAAWSLLVAKSAGVLPQSYGDILDFFNAGDLVLVAARPRMGKTIFAFGLVAQAAGSTRPTSHIFTLVEREQDARSKLAAYDQRLKLEDDGYRIDCSDDICADHIIATATGSVEPGSLIVVDYLQVLDEKRVNPPIQAQIAQLKAFAKTTGCIIVFLCQLDRQVGDRTNQPPTMDDIRTPNPLELDAFNKTIFLYRASREADQTQVSFAGHTNHRLSIGLDPQHVRFV